jgi:hypothetical protein
MARIWLSFVVLVVSGTVVGCGGSSAAGGKDPATLAPANAVGYAEVKVRPEGDVRDGALAAAGKVLRTPDPGPKLRELVDQALEGEADYARDIEPWIGERAGIWATGLEGAEDQFALIFQVRDKDAAEAALGRISKNLDAGARAGFVEDFVVIAEKASFARVEQVAAADEDKSLAKLDRYEKAIDPLPGERLGHFYFDTSALVKAASAASGSSDAALLQSFLPQSLPAGAGALIADGDRIAIETVSGKTKSKFLERLRGSGKTSPLVKDLPGDAFVAFGLPKVGSTARETIQALAGGFGVAGLAITLKNETGLDLEEDVLGWIGDVAFFARGESEDTLDGAVVIEVTDSEKAAGAFGKLAAIARARGAAVKPLSLPGAESAFELSLGGEKPGVMARTADRVVLGYGQKAVADALAPAQKLGESPAFAEAAATLDGMEPSALVDVQRLVRLIDAESADDPDWREAKRYAEAFSVLTLGSESGDDGRSRFAAGFK